MSVAVWIIASLIAYIVGMVVLVRVTPRLYYRSYDEELFLGIAALDILGAILAFGGIIVTLALFNGAAGVRILDFLMLIGILIVSIYLARKSLRRPTAGTFRTSLIVAAGFSIFLLLASLYSMVQLILLK
ncbi:MAG TPA: hypothetical protein DHW02_07900 [Ktedonobacter sp.]|nr:hypothetical protein [Ktedonobacter sp.]